LSQGLTISRETKMDNKPSAAASKPRICYNCGKKLHAPEEIIENERAEYCETCYRDRFFYHTPNGGNNKEQM
jgi:hypothetical protein